LLFGLRPFSFSEGLYSLSTGDFTDQGDLDWYA